MPPFQYTPLKDGSKGIRLIQVDDTSLEDELLRCTMITYEYGISLLDRYIALSYTWGDTSTRVPVLLDGAKFYITLSLDCALRRLPASETINGGRFSLALLWVDAICIDQGNNKERDEQVRRMKDIYRYATTVVIWLGDYEDPHDRHIHVGTGPWVLEGLGCCSALKAAALELARYLSVLSKSYRPNTMFVQPFKFVRGMTVDILLNRHTWVQLSRLFHRPWFERLWIIQELGLSMYAFALWGNTAIHWSILRDAAAFILRPGLIKVPRHIRQILPFLGAHRINQVDLDSMFNVDTKNILTALHNTQQAKCTDARDRLYAILGIVEDTEDVNIDYSISVAHVYRNWAIRRIQRTQSLDIFSACADSKRSGDLPSWVPDLRRPFGQDKPLWIACLDKKRISEAFLQPATPAQPKFRFSESGRIKGLSTVADAASGLRDATDIMERLKAITQEWQNWCLRERYNPPVFGDNKVRESLLRELLLDKDKDSSRIAEFEVWRSKERMALQSCINSAGIWNEAKQEEVLKEFERWYFPRVHGCQMFVTMGKNVGIVAGNCNAQKDDEVWFLNGGLTPFILRAQPDHQVSWPRRLISPCYLADSMEKILDERYDMLVQLI